MVIMETKTLVGIVAVAAIVATAAVLIAYAAISSSGRIIGFGVECSIDAIDWGDIAPEQQKQVSFTVTNTGDRDGTLTMTSNAPDYLTLTWDSEGALLQTAQTRTVTLTLTASASAQPQDFNFDIVITLTEAGGE